MVRSLRYPYLCALTCALTILCALGRDTCLGAGAGYQGLAQMLLFATILGLGCCFVLMSGRIAVDELGSGVGRLLSVRYTTWDEFAVLGQVACNSRTPYLYGMYKGNVMIAIYASIAAHRLPAIIREFTDLHPSINIQIEETTKNRIEKLVASGKADLSFCSRLSNQSYEWIPFDTDEMVAILPKDHHDACLESYPIKNCRREDIIMPSEGDDADVRELLKKHGIVPNIRLTTLENFTAINMVAKGLGIGIMNKGITVGWDTDTVILPLDPPSSIELGISLPSLETAAPAVREFVFFAADKLGAKIEDKSA